MPHLDVARAAERAHAAELSRQARIEADRSANSRGIREQIEDGSAGVGGSHSSNCPRCGSPFGGPNICGDCRERDWEDKQREKLSPEEIYPHPFLDQSETE